MARQSPLAATAGTFGDFILRSLSQLNRNTTHYVSYRANHVASQTASCTKPTAWCSRVPLRGWRHFSYRIVRLYLGSEFIRRTYRGNYQSRRTARFIRSKGGTGLGGFTYS